MNPASKRIENKISSPQSTLNWIEILTLIELVADNSFFGWTKCFICFSVIELSRITFSSSMVSFVDGFDEFCSGDKRSTERMRPLKEHYRFPNKKNHRIFRARNQLTWDSLLVVLYQMHLAIVVVPAKDHFPQKMNHHSNHELQIYDVHWKSFPSFLVFAFVSVTHLYYLCFRFPNPLIFPVVPENRLFSNYSQLVLHFLHPLPHVVIH